MKEHDAIKGLSCLIINRESFIDSPRAKLIP